MRSSATGYPFFPGWGGGLVTMVLRDDGMTDWGEVKELLTELLPACTEEAGPPPRRVPTRHRVARVAYTGSPNAPALCGFLAHCAPIRVPTIRTVDA